MPEDDVLAITMMCGLHMISLSIVEKEMALVRSGKESADKAARELAALCPCGISN